MTGPHPPGPAQTNPAPISPDHHDSLTLLGTGDSKGVPRFWCACPVCTEARGANGQPGLNRRARTVTLLRSGGQAALLDAGPDTHAALARLPGPLVPDAVFISHAHNDHMLGLGDLLDYVRYAAGRLRIYAPPEVIPALAARFPYAFGPGEAGPVQPIPPQGVPVGRVTVRAFRVPHGANGHSHAYRLDRPAGAGRAGWSAAVVTDAIGIPPELAREWLTAPGGAGLDTLVLGTSFEDESGAPLSGRSVYDVREALTLPWARAARQVILTHLSHGVDVRRAAHLPPGWRYARDDLTTPLSGHPGSLNEP
ncbi:MBL fold metallo-hydrolase [Deinococcus knuensis]|uniref:MBL fold metallo-hydrolase n=1 Tax=Deinococcus knuensis TaxID=1837380 RepID=A0ABQ2SDC0_9DEIO|nr:MBL fold metallo-hydrolase [Deinococcus knuensis]GGS13595.1 MBL fold metallo-hydrolase [Deinococcus knuensis]